MFVDGKLSMSSTKTPPLNLLVKSIKSIIGEYKKMAANKLLYEANYIENNN
jgi:hypothetical protein